MCPERKWRPRGPGISRLGGPKARDTQEALEAQKWPKGPKGISSFVKCVEIFSFGFKTVQPYIKSLLIWVYL